MSGAARRRPPGAMLPIGDLVASWSQRRGLDPRANATGPDALFEPTRWCELVGDDLAAAGTPQHLRDGELTIVATDEFGAVRLRYSVDAIRIVLNEALGGEVVDKVRIRRRQNRR